jgi:putative glycosyltransferase (TIGR04372 family)
MAHHVLDFTDPVRTSPLVNLKTFSAMKFLSSDDRLQVDRLLEHLSVPVGAPIALLHVRNSSHDTALNKHQDYDVDSVNASPLSFQTAVDHLKRIGVWVITVGNHPSSITGLEGVTEYHRSPLRTPLLDFLIGSVAHWYVGTAAGAPTGIALHFRLPALWTNHLIWNSEINAEAFSFGRALIVPKNVVSRGELLPQSQIVGHGFTDSDRALRGRGTTVRENSSQDILDALQEVMALGTSPEAWNQARQGPEQSAFWEVFDAHTRLERVCKQDGAVISPSFLQRNPHWLR